ncbi:MAG TPA: COQ9 family protein, partial [Alphaproteobacteria bacterium]|nr:COQ9 family protein [Alphaproteobacteria bacterium]
VLDGFADLADRRMMDHLATVSPEGMRVRDKVRAGVAARLSTLAPYKEAVRAASSFWARPSHAFHAGRILWRTADRIWVWAGDTSSDYNHYTKRGLLSGILASTTLAWLAPENDDDPAMPKTLDFLDRRIDNALSVGQLAGRFPFFRKAS